MRILAIFPGLNPKFDDLSHAMDAICQRGNPVMVLAAQLSGLKSTETGSLFERVGNVTYYRPYLSAEEMMNQGPNLAAAILEQVRLFAPDVIFASSFRGLAVGKVLRMAGFDVPILMRVEHLDPLHAIYSRRSYLGFKWLGRILGRSRWQRNAKYLQGVVTTNPQDLFIAHGGMGVDANKIFYAPHCNQLPMLDDIPPTRDKGLMVYIGSLIRDKNCDRWQESILQIFNKTPVERFLVIGDGPYRHVVNTMRKKFGSRLEHIVALPRLDALERLRRGYFAYTEATFGWGFIGDCWATGTPLLAPNSTYGLVGYVDALVPKSKEQMVSDINRLYCDPALYDTLTDGGLRRYNHFHTAEVVAKHYLAAIGAVVDRCSRLPTATSQSAAATGC